MGMVKEKEKEDKELGGFKTGEVCAVVWKVLHVACHICILKILMHFPLVYIRGSVSLNVYYLIKHSSEVLSELIYLCAPSSPITGNSRSSVIEVLKNTPRVIIFIIKKKKT